MTTTNDGVKLAYRVLGDGPRTVILVHGWMVSGRVWDDLVAMLGAVEAGGAAGAARIVARMNLRAGLFARLLGLPLPAL